MITFAGEHYLLIMSVLLLVFGILYNLSSTYNYILRNHYMCYLSVLILFNYLILNITDLAYGTIYFNNFFVKTPIEFFIQIINTLLLIFVIIIGNFYNNNNNILKFELYIFILFSFFSLSMLICSIDFISIYFFIELQSISFYILASFNNKRKNSLESGLKYFILSSLSSILLLIGFSFIYSYTGSMSIIDIYSLNLFMDSIYIYIGFIFVVVSFMFKLYAAPFHLWIPEIYEGTLNSIVLYFAVVPFINIFYVFVKISYYLFSNINYVFYIFILGISSLLIGTFGAIYQRKFKKLLAYSTITNVGYFIIHFIYVNDIYLMYIISIYIIIYSLATLGFASWICVLYDLRSNKNIENWTDLSGILYKNKLLFLLFISSIFSAAGIPPFATFFSKLMLLGYLIKNGNYIYAVIIITIAIITFYYYLRMIKIMSYNTMRNKIILKKIDYIYIYIILLILVINIYISISILSGTVSIFYNDLLYVLGELYIVS